MVTTTVAATAAASRGGGAAAMGKGPGPAVAGAGGAAIGCQQPALLGLPDAMLSEVMGEAASSLLPFTVCHRGKTRAREMLTDASSRGIAFGSRFVL